MTGISTPYFHPALSPEIGDTVIFRHYDGEEYAAVVIKHPDSNDFLNLHVFWRTIPANPLIFGVPHQHDLYSYGWRRRRG